MATWSPFSGALHYFYGGANAGTTALNKYYARFEYDVDQTNPRYIACRVVFDNTQWKNPGGTDYIYMYIPSGLYLDVNKTVSTNNLLLHDGNTKKLPQETATFYLFKNVFDEGFTFPEFWICHQGRQGTLGQFSYSFFDPNSGSRKNFKTILNSGNCTMPYHNGYTPPSLKNNKGTISIVDNGDNTFTVSGNTPNKNPTTAYKFPNEITSSKVVCTIWEVGNPFNPITKEFTVDKVNGTLNNVSFSKTIDVPANTKEQRVTATIVSTGTYNNPDDTVTGIDIPVFYYTTPKDPSEKPNISAYKDSSLTNIESKPNKRSYLKFKWKIGEGGNNASPVKGCRIYFYTKKASEGTWVAHGSTTGSHGYTYSDIWYVDSSNRDLSTSTLTLYNINGSSRKNVNVTINRGTGECYFSMSCNELGLNKDDSVKIWMEPWHWHTTRSGDNYWWVEFVSATDIPSSKNESNEMNLGTKVVVKVKTTPTSWSEGQVFVNTSTGWKEAESVFIKTTDGWKEST